MYVQKIIQHIFIAPEACPDFSGSSLFVEKRIKIITAPEACPDLSGSRLLFVSGDSSGVIIIFINECYKQEPQPGFGFT